MAPEVLCKDNVYSKVPWYYLLFIALFFSALHLLGSCMVFMQAKARYHKMKKIKQLCFEKENYSYFGKPRSLLPLSHSPTPNRRWLNFPFLECVDISVKWLCLLGFKYCVPNSIIHGNPKHTMVIFITPVAVICWVGAWLHFSHF